ncbi:eclosion hormone [Epargyreus clarus]|uniref:eclosion hormone n=1 Tax=Epargyreus clarus TaxID=520877 RepID=UPI003C2C8763
MAGAASSIFFIFTIATFLSYAGYADANPIIAAGYDPLEICIENCALCKKMLGAWFEGPLCADSCFKYKGKLIPECEDYGSISRFLNKL